MTRILGVDPGTRTLGYGVIDDEAGPAGRKAGRCRYVECGTVEVPGAVPAGTSATMHMVQRLGLIGRTLEEIIDELRPDQIAIELAFHGRNAASALKLGQVRGAVMLLAAQQGLPLAEYAPSQIKQVVAGHGRATKHDVQQRVRLLLRMRREPKTDAADALAVALCHATSAVTLTAVPQPRTRSRKRAAP